MKQLKGLFFGGRPDNLSMGRVMLWLLMIPAVYKWGFTFEDIHPYHAYALYGFIFYVLLGKAFSKTIISKAVERSKSDINISI